MQQTQQQIDQRLMAEISRIKAFQKSNRIPKNWHYLGPEIKDGIPNYQEWIFCWTGNEGNMQGGVYKAKFKLQGDLRTHPPQIYMEDKFQHMHVYGHGLVCFPFVDQYKWRSNITLYDVAYQLEKMFYNEPDINSPANDKLKNMYIANQAQYYDTLKQQAQKFSNYQIYKGNWE